MNHPTERYVPLHDDGVQKNSETPPYRTTPEQRNDTPPPPPSED